MQRTKRLSTKRVSYLTKIEVKVGQGLAQAQTPIVQTSVAVQQPVTGQEPNKAHDQKAPRAEGSSAGKPKKFKVPTDSREDLGGLSVYQVLEDARLWMAKVARHPQFQVNSTRNSKNPRYKSDGMIGQDIAAKLAIILKDN